MFDELHVTGFHKGLDQLLPQTDEFVAMRHRKPVLLGDHAHFLALHVEEVDIRRESAQQVEDVVTTVVAYDAFALDGRNQFHGLFFVVEHAMGVDFQRLQGEGMRWLERDLQ